jgi:hypothetical protein
MSCRSSIHSDRYSLSSLPFSNFSIIRSHNTLLGLVEIEDKLLHGDTYQITWRRAEHG